MVIVEMTVVGEIGLFRPGRVAGAIHLSGHCVTCCELVVLPADRLTTLGTHSAHHRAAAVSNGVHMPCKYNVPVLSRRVPV